MNLASRYNELPLILGRSLLGLYFLLPGVSKVFTYTGTLELMITKGVPLAFIALPITIIIQVGFATCLILNKNVQIGSLVLFCLTILINVFIHDFWNLGGDASQSHETQNFVKNLAIASGLLVLSGTSKELKS